MCLLGRGGVNATALLATGTVIGARVRYEIRSDATPSGTSETTGSIWPPDAKMSTCVWIAANGSQRLGVLPSAPTAILHVTGSVRRRRCCATSSLRTRAGRQLAGTASWRPNPRIT